MGVDYGTGMPIAFGHGDKWHNAVVAPHYDRPGITLLPTLLRPKSRGTVTLSGASIHDDPIIDPNYVSDPHDLQTMVEGMKFLKDMEKTTEFKKHKITKFEPDKMFCGDHEPFTDAYYACYVRHHCQTVYHPVATCAMGPNTKVHPKKFAY